MKILLLLLLLAACGQRKERAHAPLRRIFNAHLSANPLFLTHQHVDCLEELVPEFPVYSDEVLRLEDGKLTVISEKRPVKLCRNFTYEPDTIEAAALNASTFSAKARDKFQNATGMNLSALNIIIGPQIRDKEMFMTDNAFYLDAEQSITFLPHSVEAKMGGISYNYWNVPMIPAHEYGHHIFSRLVGDSPFPVVLNSFSEGFADLVAYYTLDGEERNLTGLKCLEKSRAPDEENFFDGTSKTISEANLKTFLTQAEGPFIDCEISDFRDTHVVGAVFANFAYKILSAQYESDDEKLKALHAWLSEVKVKQHILVSLPKSRYFEEHYLLFVNKAVRNWDPSTCDLISEIYPALSSKIPHCTN